MTAKRNDFMVLCGLSQMGIDTVLPSSKDFGQRQNIL
jgi:hypothetical protein